MASGRKRKRATAGTSLCTEMILEILARLPPKDAIKFQAVCKEWRSLIREVLLPQFLPLSMDGFFYHTRRINSLGPAHIATRNPGDHPFFCKTRGGNGANNTDTVMPLAFLPFRLHTYRIVDSCNGMLLCQNMPLRAGWKFKVCNPATKSWQQLNLPRNEDCSHPCRYFLYLAFDPLVSSHYKVLAWSEFNWRYYVYSSEKKMWTDGGRVIPGKSSKATRRIQYPGVYCDGAVYVATSGGISRFDLGKVKCSLVKFPPRARKPGNQAILGRLAGHVCYAAFSGLQLKVWMLDGNGWSLKYCNWFTGIREMPGQKSGSSRSTMGIVALHPHSEAVFLMEKGTVYSYDLKKMSLMEACKLGTLFYEVVTVTCFPFSPCLIDVLENKQDEGNVQASASASCTKLKSLEEARVKCCGGRG